MIILKFVNKESIRKNKDNYNWLFSTNDNLKTIKVVKSMYCKNCGRKIRKNFCLHCGLMTNGIFIDTKKPIVCEDIEIYLGKDYDKIIRNENWLDVGLLGPTYLICRNFRLAGWILLAADTIITMIFMLLSNVFLFYSVVWLFECIYLFINRLVWAAIGNIIYLKLLDKKINKYKQKHPNKYKNFLANNYKKDKFLLSIRYVILFLVTFKVVEYLIWYIFASVGIMYPIAEVFEFIVMYIISLIL